MAETLVILLKKSNSRWQNSLAGPDNEPVISSTSCSRSSPMSAACGKGSTSVSSLFQKAKLYGYNHLWIMLKTKKVLMQTLPHLFMDSVSSNTSTEWALPLQMRKVPRHKDSSCQESSRKEIQSELRQRNQARLYFKALTIFLMSFFIQVDISFHVPDELVSQQLGFGSCPQDVFSDITHLQPYPVQ